MDASSRKIESEMKIPDNPSSSFNMTIEDFLKKLTLPKRYFSKDFVIAENFHDEITLFFKSFVLCDGSEFPETEQQKVTKVLSKIHPSIEQNFSIISRIFTHHENADPKAAQIEFDKLMENIRDDLFIGTIDDKVLIEVEDKALCPHFRKSYKNHFFRVRATDSFSNEISNNADEMFHLPISQRQKVSNRRFSLAGFPSLYLSTSLPLAWQETGYPQKYYYSEYQYKYPYDISGNRDFTNEMKFISLYSPDELISWGKSSKVNFFDHWLEIIARYLKTYPLTLACSFVNLSGDTPYKQEYIIPQMLMQWIQRNPFNAQGITYFSCLETSIITKDSEAYNIALPALKPYDEKMYSIKLKETFRWSMPNYYSIPVSDPSLNADDRKILDDFIIQITNALRIVCFPTKMAECLLDMLHISSCLQSLFACAANTDMQLVLHMLDSINSNYNNIRNISLEKYITEAKTDKNTQNTKNNLDEILGNFSIIYNQFVDNGSTTGEIKKLIEKIILSTWNSLPQQSYIDIFYSPSCNIDKLIDWLDKKHILYFIRLLSPDNETIADLKEMANSQGILMDDFFSIPVGDDEWVKENISLINQPIIKKWNKVHILSPKNAKEIEFVLIGFDESELSNRLEITNPRAR